MAAGEHLLDRLFGKPLAASVNINRDDLSLMSDDEVRAERNRLAAALAACS
jgi:hypothetical protein